MKLPHSTLHTPHSALKAGFTMVEIAICLAVIGFALVAIIGVLPIGMNVQKNNREETIINFDANYLMDAIRSGAQGEDILTNYVVIITNISTLCNSNAVPYPNTTTINWFSITNYSLNGNLTPSPALTNGAVIMGLLCQPKYQASGANGDYISNYVTADFRPLTGSPLDQGASGASKDFAFTYRLNVEIVPSAEFPYTYSDGVNQNLSAPGQTTPANPSVVPYWPVAKNLEANMNEIRLRFRWPVLPGGKLGNGNLIYRTSASGWLAQSLIAFSPNPKAAVPPVKYYLIQPQSYVAAP